MVLGGGGRREEEGGIIPKVEVESPPPTPAKDECWLCLVILVRDGAEFKNKLMGVMVYLTCEK